MCYRPDVSPVTQTVDQFCADFGIDVPRSDVVGGDATYRTHFSENEVAALIHQMIGKEYSYDEQNDGTRVLMRVESMLLRQLMLL